MNSNFLRIVKRICTCIVLFVALYFTALLADQVLPNSYFEEVFYTFMFAFLIICILGSLVAIVLYFFSND